MDLKAHVFINHNDMLELNNDTVRNAINFGVDNSSLSHSDNRKHNFLLLRENSTTGINGTFGLIEKNFSKHKIVLEFAL